MIHTATRKELIADLPRAYREQNNLVSMSDDEIIDAWKRFSETAGTEDWDDVEIAHDC